MRTLTLESRSLVTAMSTFPSPLKSPVATPDGNPPTGWLAAARKVPLALASRTLSVPEGGSRPPDRSFRRR